METNNKKIIEVKGIGKKYNITHQRGGYVALRDVIASVLKSPLKFLKSKVKQVTGLEKKEEFWALKDINFEVQKGEVIGIIGRNGAGKSTLLKILSQITPPTTGEIRINGTVGSLLEVGTGFHPELTGRENIFLNGAILGMKKSEIVKKFDEIVKFADIEKFLDTPVKYYSSGMYVRLAFSVAAHMDTDILIIDEVLAVGDAEFQKKCLGKMEDITQKQGRTIIFVSHSINAIQSLCQKCILLEKGEIKFLGNTQECLSKYTEKKEISGQIFWDDIKKAPGNESVKIKSVKIICDGKITSNVSIEKDITIEITYQNFKEKNIIRNSIHIKDSSNSYVFASLNLPSDVLTKDQWSMEERKIGLYVSSCTIPANLLNNKTYSIDIGIMDKNVQHEFIITEILFFTVVDKNKMKKEYTGDWVGVVRPKLDWITKFLKEN